MKDSHDADGYLARKFAEFDATHPEIFQLYEKFAVQLKYAGGRKHGSSQQIIERIRWDSQVNPERDGGFKISHWYRTLYALKLIAVRPEFKGFFRFRKPKPKAAPTKNSAPLQA